MKKLILLSFLVCIFAANAKIVDSKYDSDTRLYGFVDENDNWVIKPKYQTAFWHVGKGFGEVSNFEYGISVKENKRALIDEAGKVYTPYEYSGAWSASPDDPITIEKNINGKELKGVVNRKGKLIVPVKYDEMFVVNPDNPDNIGLFATHFILATTMYGDNEKKVLYDWNGKQLIQGEHDNINEWTTGDPSFRVGDNGKYGLYSASGKKLLDVVYDQIFIYSDSEYKSNFAGPMKDNKRGIYSPSKEKFIIPMEYNDIKEAGIPGLFIVKKDDKWGVMGDGKVLVPIQYDTFDKFENEVAKAVMGNEVTLIKNPLVEGSTIAVEEFTASTSKSKDKRAVSRYPAPNSDVDKDIPENKADANRFAIIICNENYADAPVPFALNDGRIFAEYCSKSLGVPAENIRLYEDATYGQIIDAVEQMKSLADAYEGDASFIFYYAGHGVPDEENNSAFLLPLDGQINNVPSTAYSLNKLYKEMAEIPAKEVVVFLDACFSGAKREDDMLIAGRGVAIKVKEEKPQGNLVVFSASTGSETAHQLSDKNHGLFTYYLLKGIQDQKSNVNLGTLTDFVSKNVKRQSVVINSKKQTPTVIPAEPLENTWRNIIL